MSHLTGGFGRALGISGDSSCRVRHRVALPDTVSTCLGRALERCYSWRCGLFGMVYFPLYYCNFRSSHCPSGLVFDRPIRVFSPISAMRGKDQVAEQRKMTIYAAASADSTDRASMVIWNGNDPRCGELSMHH